MILLTSIVLTTMLLQSGLPPPPETAKESTGSAVPTTYTLGADDQIVIRAVDVGEIDDKPVRIDSRGNINLPIAGQTFKPPA